MRVTYTFLFATVIANFPQPNVSLMLLPDDHVYNETPPTYENRFALSEPDERAKEIIANCKAIWDKYYLPRFDAVDRYLIPIKTALTSSKDITKPKFEEIRTVFDNVSTCVSKVRLIMNKIQERLFQARKKLKMIQRCIERVISELYKYRCNSHIWVRPDNYAEIMSEISGQILSSWQVAIQLNASQIPAFQIALLTTFVQMFQEEQADTSQTYQHQEGTHYHLYDIIRFDDSLYHATVPLAALKCGKRTGLNYLNKKLSEMGVFIESQESYALNVYKGLMQMFSTFCPKNIEAFAESLDKYRMRDDGPARVSDNLMSFMSEWYEHANKIATSKHSLETVLRDSEYFFGRV